MSRTIPRVYVAAAWSKNPVEAVDQAKKYCGILARAGYLPLCPVLAFNGIIDEDDPDGEKKRREMAEDLIRCSRAFVRCGKNTDAEMKKDRSIAVKNRVIPTTLKDILECGIK